jgi:hypothetical protein
LYGTVVSTVLLRHFFLDIIIRVKRRWASSTKNLTS